MKEENQTIIKAINMFGRVPEQYELLEEIERLKGNIEILSDDLGNIGYMLGLEEGSCYEDVLEEIRKLQQKENIIKEVREYIENMKIWDIEQEEDIKKLLEILGKEVN